MLVFGFTYPTTFFKEVLKQKSPIALWLKLESFLWKKNSHKQDALETEVVLPTYSNRDNILNIHDSLTLSKDYDDLHSKKIWN